MQNSKSIKMLNIFTPSELDIHIKEQREERLKVGVWGNWTLKKDTNELKYRGDRYFIDLDRINDAKDALGNLAHMIEKIWFMADNNIANYIQAIEDIKKIDFSGALRNASRSC